MTDEPKTKLGRSLAHERRAYNERTHTVLDDIANPPCDGGLMGALTLACGNPRCPGRSFTVEIDERSTAVLEDDHGLNMPRWLISTKLPEEAPCPFCGEHLHFVDFEPRDCRPPEGTVVTVTIA